MKKNEYIEKLKKIEEQFDSNSCDNKEIMQLIDELYAYKPVSLRLMALKCKVLIKMGECDVIVKQFSNLYTYESSNVDNIALWKQVIRAYENVGITDKARYESYLMSRLIKSSKAEQEDINLYEVRQRFVLDDESLNTLTELEDMYMVTGNVLMAFCISLYKSKLYGVEEVKTERYQECGNIAYFKERIETKCTVIIIAREDDKTDYDILTYVLHKLGVHVYMISDIIHMDEEFDIKASASISLDNRQVYEDCIIIPAIAKYDGQKYVEDNIPYIVDVISKNETKKDFAMVIASNNMLEELRINPSISKRFERLSDYQTSYMEDKIGFAWSGDYYEYISFLYNEDVKKCVSREPEVMFSIVVPVRNATKTLYYTLKTCIEQDYKGKYEILLSDNSSEDNNEACEVYKKLNNKVVKYIRTPRDLNLIKSFEYAYLQTRGKYIISIGADDAMLPWALSTLEAVWEKNCSHRNIIRWDRGFYAWPGFNGGQENQLSIPSHYKKNNITGEYHSSDVYFNMIKGNPQAMYSLPNLYINSGFKREYMKKIYDITGRLWDGYAQDIYTGLQNICIEKEVLYIPYPITVAGMSSSSVGAMCTSVSMNNKDNDKLRTLSGGLSLCKKIKTSTEYLMPEVMTDVRGLYKSIDNLIAKGILKADFYKSEDDVKNMCIKCWQSHSMLSDRFEKNIYEGYEMAKKRSDDFKLWFEINILSSIETLRYYDADEVEERKKQKTYREGYLETGGVILDASRYGVTNIYEAVQLFKDFLNF